MPLTDLSSSHIRVFNLPFCNLFQQSQGSGSYTWPACIWRLIFSLSSVPSWANDAFSQDWKSLRKCYTSKGRCAPVPKELCLRQTTPLSVYPNSPSFGWQQGSKKNKKQYMLGCKRAWHNYFPKKNFKALCCLWSNSLNHRETFHPDQGWEFAIQAVWLRPRFCISPSLSSGSPLRVLLSLSDLCARATTAFSYSPAAH